MMSHRKPGAATHPAAGDPASVLELLDAGIWDWNVVTGELYLSPAWKRQLGYGDDELENHVRTVDSLLHPDDLARVEKDRRQIQKERSDFFEDELRLRHKDGSYRWLFGRARVVRDEDGNVVRMVGVDTDITERKRIEQALAESQERAQRAHRLSKTAHWSWTPDRPGGDWQGGRIDFETAADVFGIDDVSIAATNTEYLDQFVHPADRARVAEAFAGTMSGRVPHYEVEYRIALESGEVKTVYEIGEANVDAKGRVTSVEGTVQDITERKQIEEALAVSESHMRRAQQISKLAHWIMEGPVTGGDWNSVAARWSDNAAAIFRTTGDMLEVASHEYIERFVHPLDREMVARTYRSAENANDGEGKPYRIQYRIMTQDGEVRTIQETAEPSVDARPGWIVWNGVVQDVTERKRMEEALASSEAQMRRAQKIAKLGHWMLEYRQGEELAGNERSHLSAGAAEILGMGSSDSFTRSIGKWLRVLIAPLKTRMMVRASRTESSIGS